MSEKLSDPNFNHDEARKAPPYPADASRDLPREVLDDLGYGWPEQMNEAESTKLDPDFIYAAKLVEAMGPDALLDKLSSLRRSRDESDQRKAAVLESMERVQGLLRERR